MLPESLLPDQDQLLSNLDQTLGFQLLITRLEEKQEQNLSKVIAIALDDSGKYTDSQALAAFRAWASKRNMVQLIKKMPGQAKDSNE